VAPTDAITLVRDARVLRVADGAVDGGDAGLVGIVGGGFRACRTALRVDGDVVRIADDARARLGVRAGEDVWVQRLA
jgi:arginine/ornithine N-succinyltransferase beta subunit